MSFPRYPDYKDSGVAWLGEVPAHWTICALKRIAMLRSGETITSDSISETGTYPVFGGNGLRGFTENFTHDGCYPLIGRQGALCGNVNYGYGRFWASEHAVVVSPINTIAHKWIGELLRAMDLNQYSVSAAQPGLSVEIILNLSVPIPPFVEQSAIAAFLDRETAKIDGLVVEQERLIELLKEKRLAVISHAVTKGLNPDAPMKDSGIEWLGEVPRHWEVLTLGKVTINKCDSPFGSGLKSEHYTDDGVRVIRLQNIRINGFDGTDEVFVDDDYYKEKIGGHDVIDGDLLLAGLGDERNTVGRACVAPPGIEPAMVKADCFRFRLHRERAIPAFMAVQLTAGSSADAGVMSSGSTRTRIPLSLMASRRVVLPSLSEQSAIVAHLDRETAKLDSLVAEAQHAIDLLKERRAALISAAVTGRIDVRGLVADNHAPAERVPA